VRTLITGAAGFLGRHVVAALRLRGHSVRALDLPAAFRAHPWEGTDVETREADLCVSDPSEACRGVDAVVHLAALLDGEPEMLVRVAETGTSRLIQAMASAGAGRMVLASSLSVYDWSGGTLLDEDAPLEPHPEARDGYTLAKLRQEAVARERCAAAGIALTVLRPGLLWGAGREVPSTIGQRLGSLYLMIAAARRLPVVHVENCADAFAAVLEGPAGTFNVIDHPEITPARFVRDHLARSGRFGVALPVPYGLARASACFLHGIAPGPVRRRLPSFLAPRRFAARYRPVRIDGARLRATGWTPPLAYQACLDVTYGAPR
jgi:nucleoside-diphosphate-sugar epimerase